MATFSGPSRGQTVLSLKQAAVLADVTEKIVRHELAARIVRSRGRKNHRVLFDPNVVLYLSLVDGIPVELPKRERKSLFDLLVHGRTACGRWRREGSRLLLDGSIPIELSLTEVNRRVGGRLKLFTKGMRRVVTSPDVLGGEPVFRGTRISVRHVGELARKGVSPEILHEDFPRISLDDIAFARMFVELGRRPGRPRKLKLVRS